MQGIISPLSKKVYQLGGVVWLGYGYILITKVSVVIMDCVSWEQNVDMLDWLGENVLGCP